MSALRCVRRGRLVLSAAVMEDWRSARSCSVGVNSQLSSSSLTRGDDIAINYGI